MLKHLRAAFVFLAAALSGDSSESFAAPVPAPQPPAADLRWKFEKDRPFYQKITTDTTQNMKVMSNDVTQRQKQTFFVKWTPIEKKNGIWQIRQEIEGVEVEIDIGGGKISYNSTKKKNNPNHPLAKFFKALVGSEFILSLDVVRLKITRIEGRQRLLKKLPAQIDEQLLNRFNDEWLIAMAEHVLAVIPDKKVNRGEKWTRECTIDMGVVGKYARQYTCVYQDMDEKEPHLDRIEIEVGMKYSLPPIREGVGAAPFDIKRAHFTIVTGSGSALFNPWRGRIEKQSVRLELAGKLEIEIGTQPTKMELSQTEVIDIEMSDASLRRNSPDARTEPLRKQRGSSDPKDVAELLPDELYIHPSSLEERLIGAAFAPNGRLLATGGQDIRLWDPRTRKIVRRFGLSNPYGFSILAFSPDGRLLFTDEGLADRCAFGNMTGGFYDICLWEVSSGKLIRKFQGHTSVICSLAVAPDGRTLVSSSADGSIRTWDTTTGRGLSRPYSRSASGQICRVVAFSPDGKILATLVDGEPVRLWDVASGREVRQLRHEQGRVRLDHMTFARDSRILAVGVFPSEKSICFWKVEKGQLLNQLSLKAASRQLSFHFLQCLESSPDGKLLVSSGEDGILRLWEMALGAELERGEARAGPSWVGFSPDGRNMAALTWNGSLLLLKWGGCCPVTTTKSGNELSRADVVVLWMALADPDPRSAFAAVQRLIVRPKLAVDLLSSRFQAIPLITSARLEELVRELDHEEFPVRERSAQELARLAEAAESALRGARTNPSLEVRRQARRLLERLNAPPSRERLRYLRAVMILEYIGTPEGRRVLERLAEGMRGIRETEEARAAYLRLERRAKAAEAHP